MIELPPPPPLEPVDTYQARLHAWYEVCDAILRGAAPYVQKPGESVHELRNVYTH